MQRYVASMARQLATRASHAAVSIYVQHLEIYSHRPKKSMSQICLNLDVSSQYLVYIYTFKFIQTRDNIFRTEGVFHVLDMSISLS